MKVAFFSGLSALLAVAAAYTTPVGDTPSGNPIYTPGLQQLVPAGKPFQITWDPTSEGTVTLVLLRGPSNNVVPLYPIVEKIANTGSYTWTPSTDLTPDVTHYGLQLIQDATGAYQYSTQFGISNDAVASSSSVVSSTAPTVASSSADVGYGAVPSSTASSSTAAAVETSSAPVVPAAAGSTVYYTSVYTVTSCGPEVTNCPASSTPVAPTGPAIPVLSTSVPAPSAGIPPVGWNTTSPTYSVPAVPAPPASVASGAAASSGVPPIYSNGTVPTTPSLPQETGAASNVRVGSYLVATIVGLAIFLS